MTPIVVPVSGVFPYESFGFTSCVRHGDVLYLSGVASLDAAGHVIGADIEAQTIQTYANIERILAAGGSGLGRILQMTSFVVDLGRNGQGYVATRAKILKQPTYTSAVIGVSALMMTGLLVEVQCCAAVSS